MVRRNCSKTAQGNVKQKKQQATIDADTHPSKADTGTRKER